MAEYLLVDTGETRGGAYSVKFLSFELISISIKLNFN